LKILRLVVLAALFLAACSNTGSGAVSSTTPTASTSPSAKPADTKAANLRVQLDLLLAEHVMVVAKQATAATNHSDEYAGYLTLLTANGASLVDVMRAAFGNTAASQFEQAWAVQDGNLIDYTIGLVTHNENKSNGAMSGLLNGFVPQFAQLIASLTQLPVSSTTQLETAQLTYAKTMIDDEVAQSYTKLYVDVRSAYANSSLIGDGLAVRMAQQFPDKFPGDPSISAVDARVALNGLLQEHSYLATMTSDAVIGGRAADEAAALGALAANRHDLGPVLTFLLGPGVGAPFDELWGTRVADLVGYASSADPGAKSRLTGAFVSQFTALAPAPAAAVQDQVVATLKVTDDQRAKALQQVAGDDRAAAAAMRAIADGID
jgi:hypothetical protein